MAAVRVKADGQCGEKSRRNPLFLHGKNFCMKKEVSRVRREGVKEFQHLRFSMLARA